jgi:hypothetical protein
MNPKKKSRRYRVSVSIHALDLAIYRFTHSLGVQSISKNLLQRLGPQKGGVFFDALVEYAFSHDFFSVGFWFLSFYRIL